MAVKGLGESGKGQGQESPQTEKGAKREGLSEEGASFVTGAGIVEEESCKDSGGGGYQKDEGKV